MKSSPVRLEQIADPNNLREAFLRAARGKANRADVITFRERLGDELFSLRQSILAGSVQVGEFRAFTIFEPKERRIHAPCFRERVLHHAIIRLVEPYFERWLIDDVYACRRGLGREKALRRAEHYARRHGWFLKLDVAKYFDSISHARLSTLIDARFRDARVVALWKRIIGAYETNEGCGLPIGALTSQFLANFYLSRIDRLAKETLRAPGYVRYMDDMALWSDDRGQLKEGRKRIEAVLMEELGLRLKANWHLQPTARGMDFLGYRVLTNGSRLGKPARRRFLRKWHRCERALTGQVIHEKTAQTRILAMAAFARTASTDTLLSRLFGNHLGKGHRAPIASTAAAAGSTPPQTAAPPTATGTRRTTVTTTSASAPPSAQAAPHRVPD
jgi:RNA-directed DNA polymerase